MRRIAACALIGLFAASSWAQASDERRTAAANDPPVTTHAPRRLPAPVLLRMRLPEVRFDKAPFEGVLQTIADLTNTNVIARWSRLGEVGIERDAPVTVRARNLRLDQILWLVLGEVGGPDVKLAYRADRDMILISTVEDFGERMITRVYDVRHLLTPRLARPNISFGRETTFVSSVTPVVAEGAVGVQPVTQVFGSGVRLVGEDAGGTIFDDEDEGEVGSFQDERMRELIEAITATIEPETWLVNGGRGSVVPYNGMLIIRNSPLVHQKVAGPVHEADGP